MSQLKYTPLATALAVGAVEDVIAPLVIPKSGSYVPRVLLDVGMVAASIVAVKTKVIPKNAGTAAHVTSAALLGRNLTSVLFVKAKL